ncbi:MAG: type II secretion system protein [bacterium]|nr:type II secretion system protein [bacterium]
MKKIYSIGFTLLELLVVIGIIGVLLGLGSVSYSTGQKKARDTRRKSDLSVLQNTFEQYYSVCGFTYPTPTGGLNPASVSIFCPNPTTGIMPTLPADPRSGAAYVLTTTGTTYSICVPTPVSGGTKPLETETVTTYCVSNQQ